MAGGESTSSIMARMARAQGDLPAALAKVGDWALAYPFRTATLKIDELAEAAGVSVASVNRYARALGFAGYPDFRAELLRAYDSTFAPVEKLRAAVSRETTHAQIMRESLEMAATNITRTLDRLQPDQCEAAVAMILEARRVFVVGLGGSAFTAGLLADALEPHVDLVRESTGFGGSERVIRRLLRVRPGDLVIGLSVPRYSRRTVDFLHLTKDRGAKIMALTDSPASPLVPLADVALLAGSDHGILHGSHIGMVALIEGLAAALTRADRDAVGMAADVTEHILPYLHVGETPPPRRR